MEGRQCQRTCPRASPSSQRAGAAVHTRSWSRCAPSRAYLVLLGAHPSVYGAHPALLGAHLALLGAHSAVHTQLYWVHTQLYMVCTQLCTPGPIGCTPSSIGCTPCHAHPALLGAHLAVHTQPCTPPCTPHACPLLQWAHAEPWCCTHSCVPHPSSQPVCSPAAGTHQLGSQRRGQSPSKATPAVRAGVPAPQIMPMHSCLSERGGLSILMEQRLGAPSRRMSTPAGGGGARGGRWAPQGSK